MTVAIASSRSTWSGTAASPHPLGTTLPGLLQEDELAQRLCEALDHVLGPVIGILDCFPAYLEPLTAPPDVLAWLAEWLGIPALDRIPEQRRRRLVARACALHAARGTASGIGELVELITGAHAELLESGGTAVSTAPGTPLPGPAEAGLVIRLHGVRPVTDLPPRPDPEPSATSSQERVADEPSEDVDVALLTQILLMVVPAHLPWTVEFA